MVIVSFDPSFEKRIKKIKNKFLFEKIKKQIAKIVQYPEIGKPMKNTRKGTREVYISPFRLSYAYLKGKDKIVILDFYHKDEQ